MIFEKSYSIYSITYLAYLGSLKPKPVRRLRSIPKMEEILQDVSECTGVDADLIKSKNRKPDVVLARNIFFFSVKDICGSAYSLDKISRFTGNRDHSRVIRGIRTLQDLIDSKDVLAIDMFYNYKLKSKFYNETSGNGQSASRSRSL